MRTTRFQRKKPEPTITLINVVFLMLIFFLVAGTIAPPVSQEVRLVNTQSADAVAPPDALVITATGETLWNGQPTAPEVFLAAIVREESDPVRIMPDRDLSALRLIEVAQALRRAGAADVRLVVERGAP